MSKIDSYKITTEVVDGDTFIVYSPSKGDIVRIPFATMLAFMTQKFLGLSDTPGSYAGQKGKVPQVNIDETALEFVSSSLAPSFITMPDTLNAYDGANRLLKINATNNGVDSVGHSFISANDTPSTYTGQALKELIVNNAESAVEFAERKFTSSTDTPANYTGSADKIVGVNTGETALEFKDPSAFQVTGWARYFDTTYTSGSPFTVAAGVTSNLPNNAGSTITSHLPPGVTAFYDGAVITPETVGDTYELRIDFIASSNNVSGLADLIIDIGGAVGEVARRTFTFPKGSGTPFAYSTTTAVYCLDTFVANGGTVKINSITGTTSIYDIAYTIIRTHKGV